MKITIEVDDNLKDSELIIRCNKIDNTVQRIQQSVQEITNNTQKFIFYKDESEYYLSLDQIMFFESADNGKINAHTADDIFQIKYKLYELEEMLPRNFIRISKSTIVNVNHIFSITKNITSSSLIQFNKSYKQAYISRFYYKDLKQRLAERGR